MPATTVVLKVGGSLLTWPGFPAGLSGYLKSLRGDRLILVVGGGLAAEHVRELDRVHRIGEASSHALALRALDLTAAVVATLAAGLCVVARPDELHAVWERGLVPVLAPRWFMENVDERAERPLPRSWEVTTDSIAARLATHLGAGELQLLKSTGPGRSQTYGEAARAGYVDRFFPAAAARYAGVSAVNLRANPYTIQLLTRESFLE